MENTIGSELARKIGIDIRFLMRHDMIEDGIELTKNKHRVR